MTHDTLGCADYERVATLSRRRFLQGVAATGAGAVATTMFGDALRQTAFGATRGGNVLVVLSLRGGIDGLGMVVPHGDPGYYSARPSIAVARNALVAQDGFFGLHPSMQPLAWLYDSGELAAVQAVGMGRPNRSHFLAMEEIEDADPGAPVRRGWVNRMIGLDRGARATEAVHINGTVVPTMLCGPAPTLSATKLDGFGLQGERGARGDDRRRHLQTVWNRAGGPLGRAGRAALQVSKQLGPVADQAYRPRNGARYPETYPAKPLGDALKDTAQLIRADVGAEIVSVDFGSWDMHAEYGTEDYGQMQAMVGAFAVAVDAFMRDLGSLRQRVTLVTISEFGRRVAENGNRGLDHGWGNMMLLMGAGVRGGRYYGTWPGLRPGSLEDGDLKVTTDYRNVLAEVITRRFPDRSTAKVFPGLVYDRLGVMQ